MSDFNNIQALLEKYWEGETTLEEERLLKGYFAAGAIDDRLRQFAPMFQAVREEQAVQLQKSKVVPIRPQMYQWQGWAMAASVALLLAAGAWWLFSTPEMAETVAHKTPTERTFEKPDKVTEPQKEVLAEIEPQPSKRIFHSRIKKVKKEKTPEINPEEEAAMAEIKAALALVSSKIRKGKEEAAKGASHLENIDRLFKKKEG